MKKFTKFLGIFLALAMVIGMLSVVGAVDSETPATAPSAPTGAILQGTTYEVVSPTRIETLFGFYEDGTGEDEDTFMDCEDGACVTDGWFGRAGYSECTSDDGLIALVMMVDDFINMGAIEVVAKDANHRPVDFVIQVMGDADWETVVTADNDPLAECLTKTFTFDAVETDTVRILINEVDANSDDGECYLNEVTLFEAGTGNLKTVIDMNGKVSASNANTSDCTNNAVDGDKSTMFTGSWMTVDLGEATAIDGFNLYHYRNSSYPNNITVSIQQTEGGEFVEIGTFATGFTSGAPVDSLYVTFDQTYMAYAITFGSDVWGYQNDYELWQYQREATEEPTEAPTAAPTEPAEPTYELTTGAPSTGVAYKWAADTGAAEGLLTFIGTSANQSYYLSTSTTMTDGVDVYVEEVTGGYQMYFMAGETKTYIDIYQNGSYVNARLTTEPTAVFTWNDTFGTFVTDIGGTAYYLGTYTKASNNVTYTTLSASKLSYMTESNVDISQFPARFYAEVGTIIPEPTTPPTEEPTPAPTEEPTEEPTPAPTEAPTPAPTEEPTAAPTEEPTAAPTEEPTQEPTRAPSSSKEKVDLIGTVVGACSTNSATAGSYADFTWWSDGRPTWKNLDNFVDGDTSTYINFGASIDAGERPDLYLDLSNGGTGYTAVDEFTIYHSSEGNVATIMVVLVLEDGTEWTKTLEVNWVQYGGHTSVTEVLPETKNAVGMYIWQNSSTGNAHFGDIEIYTYTGSTEPEPTEPSETPTEPSETPTEPSETPTEPSETPTEPSETPTEPVEAPEDITVVTPGTTTITGGVVKEGDVYKKLPFGNFTAQFGYYNASGTFVDGNDGSCCIDGWYGRAGYSECTTSDGQMALILTHTETKLIGRVEIVARLERLNNAPAAFEIQAMVDGDWVTVTNVTENPFTTTATAAYTFTPVMTNQIRILIHAVADPAEVCHINEVEVYEITTGKIYNDIDLVGKLTATDAFGNNPGTNIIDGDKSSNTTGANFTINLTDADGNPTSIDGFRLFFHRGNATYAQNATIMVQTVAGGEFTSIGTFSTGWSSGDPREVPVFEFEQTYDAYAIQVNFDSAAPIHEFELFQYQKDAAPVDPEQPTEPSDPTEPSETPTEPSETPTEPSETPTEPSETPTEPSETPTEPSETPTEPSETPTEPSETPTEPAEDVDTTDLDATLELIEVLDTSAYTAESLAALESVLEEVNAILASENLTQEMVDEAYAMLQAALEELVPVEDTGDDQPDLPDVPELPGPVDLSTIQATIDLIYDLNPSDYTAESYANLIDVVKNVNKILAMCDGYTQKMIDDINDKLAEGLAGLVRVDGGSDVPGGDDVPGDDDLPADTGDIMLTVLSGMMTISAIGGAVVVGKKKFF